MDNQSDASKVAPPLNNAILIVDDNEGNLKLLAEILTAAGYSVRPANSSALALQSIQAQPPALILLDIRMPEMDGFEVCQRLKADERTRSIPVIFITILESTEDKIRGFEVGGVDFIIKPFDRREVLARVGTQLALRRTQLELARRSKELEATNTILSAEIEEHKRSEAALRQSETRFRQVFERQPSYCYLISPDGKILDINQAALNVLGYQKDELVGKSLPTIYAPEAHPKMQNLLAQWQATGIIQNEEMTIISRAGERRTVLLSVDSVRDEQGNVLHSISVQQDITERKQHESQREATLEALYTSEERFRQVLDNSLDAAYRRNLQAHSYDYISPVYERISGFSVDEMKTMSIETVVANIHPEDQDQVEKAMAEANQNPGLPFTLEYRFRHKAGQYLWFQDQFTDILDTQGRPSYRYGSVRDITRRKQAEQELEQHRQHLEELVERRRTVELTQEIAEHQRAEQDLQSELAVKNALSALYQPLTTPTVTLEEISMIVFQQACELTASEHGFTAIIDPLTGVTKAYNLTAMLPKQCQVADENQLIAFPRGPDGRYPGLWGYSLNTRQAFFTNQPQSHPAFSGSSPAGHIPIQRFLAAPVLLGEEMVGLIALANSSHEYTWKDLLAIGRLAEFFALAIQSKRVEAALQTSEERFRTIVTTVNEGIYMLDHQHRFTFVNERMATLLGYTSQEMLNQPAAFIINPEEQADHAQKLTEREQGKQDIYERRLLRKNNEVLWVLVAATPKLDAGGNFCGSLGTVTDITPHKLEEAALRLSIQEKEVLMKELQHRVKNSLNVVASLLGLALDDLSDERSQAVLADAQSRIYSIAVIYEQLYHAGGIESIEMGGYIQDLVSGLLTSYTSTKDRVKIETQVEQISVDMRRAVSLGLIANELITNAIKYAFPPGGAGVIRVELEQHAGQVTLRVADNGVGVKEALPVAGTGMGLRLVEMLAKQIGGNFEMESGQGTTAQVTFSIDPPV